MKKIFAQTKIYIVVLLSVLVLIIWALALGSRPMSSSASPVRVVIARGTSAGDIARVLGNKGLIRSPFVFLLTCRINGSGARLKPGVYELNQAMSVPQIIRKLELGESLETWVTFPEGFTIRQMADLLQKKQLADSDAFLQLSIDGAYDFSGYPFLYGESLEGYLFPDTYLIARGTNAESIIERMLDTFEKKVAIRYRSELEETIKKRFGLGEESFPEGLQKIMTLASLVEREAKTDKDRRLIASVMWNRLAKHMKLDVDATVTYSPGESRENKKRVLYKDLENDSPYNTYKHAGLPPSPICSPGLASIRAVLDPAVGDYLYYVAKKDGSHVFSRTLQEHDAAKNAIKSGAQ